MADRLLYPHRHRVNRLLPRPPVAVDFSHSLLPDRLYVPAFKAADLVRSSRLFTATLNPPPAMTFVGPGYSFTGGSGFQAGTGPFLGGFPAWTICALMQTSTGTSGSGGTIYCERAASGNDIAKIHVSQSTGSCACAYQNDAGSLVNQTSGGPNITDGFMHLIAGVYDGTNVISYVDGVVVQSTVWPGANNNFTNGAIQQTIGYDVADATGNYTGSIVAVWLYRHALSLTQILALSREPFAMLRPVSGRVMASMAAGAGAGTSQAQAMVLA